MHNAALFAIANGHDISAELKFYKVSIFEAIHSFIHSYSFNKS